MAQARPKNPSASHQAFAAKLNKLIREAAFLCCVGVALFALIALISYDHADPGWSYSTPHSHINNAVGLIGAWFADIALYLLGWFAYLLPALIIALGWFLFRGIHRPDELALTIISIRLSGALLLLIAGAGLADLHFGVDPEQMPIARGGGVLGDVTGSGMLDMFNFLGATLFLLVGLLIGLTMSTGLSWVWLMDKTGALSLRLTAIVAAVSQGIYQRLRQKTDQIQQHQRQKREFKQHRQEQKQLIEKRREIIETAAPPKIEPVITELPTSKRVEEEKQLNLIEPAPDENTGLPTLGLLDEPSEQSQGYSAESLKGLGEQLEVKLLEYRVEARVVGIQPGPVITRFEVEPAPGVKASKITSLDKDLARSLSVISVRVVEVIPGKSFIGVEIPNEKREMIFFSEMMRSEEFERSKAKLPIALGKDISGKPVIADIAKMPHLLVAGTTGSGKSVGVNAMILSLLYRLTADEVRLIMIDPKMLELSIYEDIPHLLAPVVTDMKEAANALRWSVAEMERRYQLMSKVGVRNLAGYNRKVRDAIKNGEPLKDPLFDSSEHFEGENAPVPELEPLPSIVVIVDEFADMMMVVGKKVEELIARLAQKARAAGIHLILATQRPSVDVITGLIKANIPSRIAFKVSSRIDSRTILDQMGAESLLGHGDMLYLPTGATVPERVHGAFVSDDEVHQVVEWLKTTGSPNYVEGLLDMDEDDTGPIAGVDPVGGSEADALFDQAVAYVTESRRGSISGVQRKFQIGYNRAARLIEAMEAAGIVGPPERNGNREVLAPPPPKD